MNSTKPFTYKATVANGNLQENIAEQTTDHAGAIIGFQTQKGEQIHARIASSFISFEQAAANMKELGKDNIEQVAKKGKEAWNQVLGKIEVEGGNLDQYRTFYSCLYRSLLSRASSMNWTPPDNRFITARTTVKSCRICTPILVFGTHSVASSHY